MYSMHL